MGGTSDQLKVHASSSMSDLQRAALDGMLGGYLNMMDNFRFGVPYPGAKIESYTPDKFEYEEQPPTYKLDPMPEGGENLTTCIAQCREDFPVGATRQNCISECRKKWIGERKPPENKTESTAGVLESGGGPISSLLDGGAAAPQAAGSEGNIWPGLFNANVALPSFGLGGGNLQPLGVGFNPAAQALVNPMSNLLTQNLTGNFPNRRY